MNIRSGSTDRLFETILSLKTVDECYDYFEDLCTVKEILDMSSRLEAAILLMVSSLKSVCVLNCPSWRPRIS